MRSTITPALTFAGNKIDLGAYLERISYRGKTNVSLETLKGIHIAHTSAIPFENLNPLLRLPVLLDIDSIQNKIIAAGRGGYCFEQNTLLMHALREIGFSVRGLAARVIWNLPPGVTPARGHMLLQINLGDEEYIADVGFGGLTLPEPLAFKPDLEQQTSHEAFRIIKSNEEFILEVRIKNEWKALYKFLSIEHYPADYEVANYYLSTNTNSHFLHGLIAARVLPGQRFALRNKELSIHNIGGETEKRIIESLDELKDLLTLNFQIALPSVPHLDETLQRILDQSYI